MIIGTTPSILQPVVQTEDIRTQRAGMSTPVGCRQGRAGTTLWPALVTASRFCGSSVSELLDGLKEVEPLRSR